MDRLLKRRTTGIIARVVAGELVVADLESSEYLSLNGTGTFLWEVLAVQTPAAQLADAIVERYGIARDQAERDVQAFIEALEDANLLEPAAAS